MNDHIENVSVGKFIVVTGLKDSDEHRRTFFTGLPSRVVGVHFPFIMVEGQMAHDVRRVKFTIVSVEYYDAWHSSYPSESQGEEDD